jgi:hypothetical protein
MIPRIYSSLSLSLSLSLSSFKTSAVGICGVKLDSQVFENWMGLNLAGDVDA